MITSKGTKLFEVTLERTQTATVKVRAENQAHAWERVESERDHYIDKVKNWQTIEEKVLDGVEEA